MILINLNQLLKKIVNEVANENNVTLNEKIVEQVEFEISAEKSRGDFATSCCLKLAKHFKKKPVELAEIIATNLNDKKIENIKIEGSRFYKYIHLSRNKK